MREGDNEMIRRRWSGGFTGEKSTVLILFPMVIITQVVRELNVIAPAIGARMDGLAGSKVVLIQDFVHGEGAAIGADAVAGIDAGFICDHG